MKFFVVVLSLSLFAAGCAHQSVVDVAPAYNIASSYSNSIPGTWALYVDADDLEAKDLHMKGFECSAHRFPIEAGSAFTQSAVKTLKNVVEDVELVERPIPYADLAHRGYAGQILLKGEELDGDLVVISGFWENKIEAEVDMAVSVRVDGHNGRILGTTVSGEDESIRGSGAFCGGGAKAVAEAGAGALKETMLNIAESISNAPRIREYATGELVASVSTTANGAGNTSIQSDRELLGLLSTERFARENNCQRPALLKHQLKTEVYSLTCADGDMIVRCEWGQCSVLN